MTTTSLNSKVTYGSGIDGQQDLIDVSSHQSLSVNITLGAGDDVDLVYSLNNDPNSLIYTVDGGAGLVVSFETGFASPVAQVGLNINTNTSGNIILEILKGGR